MCEARTSKMGFGKSGESPCYSEDILALDLVSAAAKRNCPANVFLKRWIVSAGSAKNVV